VPAPIARDRVSCLPTRSTPTDSYGRARHALVPARARRERPRDAADDSINQAGRSHASTDRQGATVAGLDALEGRLSWHSLRHSAGSIWLTEYGVPVTTVSAMMGHANPSFTLACYGRDPRDEQTMIADVLARAAAAGS
jgi:integrase